MLRLSCLCERVSIVIERRPEYMHECNCKLCTRSGARWAYFEPAQIKVCGTTSTYRRSDKPEAGANIHFCPSCGTTTHFTLTPEIVERLGNTVAGVNMRLADDADVSGIELRFPDGRAWGGEGPFGYVRDPEILG